MMIDLFSDDVFGPYKPGIHYSMSDKDYHSIKAVSNSSLKIASRSMRHFKSWLNSDPVEQTPAMRWGTIVHMAIFEPHRFSKDVIYTEAKNKSAKEYKETIKELEFGQYALDAPEVKKLTDMLNELMDTPTAASLIKDGAPEVVVLTTDPVTGLKMKCKMDFISTDPDKPYILDYKTTTDCKPTEAIAEPGEKTRPSDFERHCYNLGYCNQAAYYLYIAEIEKLKAEFYVLLAQEKDPPYIAQPYIYGFETLDCAKTENRKLLNQIAECAKQDKWPGYSESRLPLFRPYWGLRDE